MKLISRFDNLSTEAKASVVYIISGSIQNGLSFLSYPIFTNIMTTEQFGLYTIYLSWMNLISIFATLKLQYGTFNVAMSRFKAKRNEYISSIQGLLFLNCMVLIVVYFIGKGWFDGITGLNSTLIIVMFFQMFFSGCTEFWLAKQRYENKYMSVFGVSIFLAFATVGTALFAVLCYDGLGEARIISEAMVVSVFGFLFFCYNMSKGRCVFRREFWNYALQFNVPLIPYYLSQMIFNHSDRLMIDYYFGKEKAGIYSLVYNLSVVFVFVIEAIHKALVARAYDEMEKKRYDWTRKYANIILAFFLIGLVLFELLGPELIYIISNSEYIDAAPVVPAVVSSVFFLMINTFFGMPLIYYMKKAYMVINTILCAVINIVLNMIFIPKCGYLSAGYTTLVTYIVFCIGYYVSLKCCMKKIAYSGRVYDNKIFLLLSVVMLFFSGIILFLYQYSVIRYVLFVTIIFVLFCLRKKIIQFFTIMKK